MENSNNISAIEWLEKEMLKPNLSMKDILEQAKEMENQQRQKTIEEVFEWLTKNNYVTDLKETLIEQFKKK
jgi:uncharacterized membrane protein YcgQ (UPF0703/DUF1980 family)